MNIVQQSQAFKAVKRIIYLLQSKEKIVEV